MYSCAVSLTGSPSSVTLPERVSSRTRPRSAPSWHCRRRGGSGAQARDQLLGLERLGEIVVGAGVEAGHLVRPAVARGQHQHRHLDALLAPAVEDGEAVDLGQAEVEDDRVIGLGRAEIMAVLAVGGMVDGIARAFERRAQLRLRLGSSSTIRTRIVFPFASIARRSNRHGGRLFQRRNMGVAVVKPAPRQGGGRTEREPGVTGGRHRPVRASTSIQITSPPRMNFSR